ncbi:MAG TPA: alkaline phosphatase family protein, partial [Polyangiaceae bacterium]|nr:alkaline phosphatase family protein [Polyangiaceae bacterium]
MLASVLRWSCLLLPLLAAVACKPPRPHQRRAKIAKSAHAVASTPLPTLASSVLPPSLLPPLVEATVSKLPSKYRSALERREACEFKKGAMPEQTLDPEEPTGQRIPIDHFVIVMQENRSFDHYFHDLAKFGQPAADVTPKGYLNPDPKAKQDVAPYHATALCGRDTRHDWNSAHKQFNDGKMDGFVSTSNPKGRRALGYYDATDLNYYYALANTFSIGDRYFASMLGPTW